MAIFKRDDRSEAPQTYRVVLGAFGVHPGWEGPVGLEEDAGGGLGLETSALLALKRILSDEGILRWDERAGWAELGDADWQGVFDHLFLWRRRRDLVVGRLWSSSTREGQRGPLFLALHLTGVPLGWVMEGLVERLEEAVEHVRAARSPAEVEAALSEARADMNAVAAGALEAPHDEADPASRFAALASRGEWGENRVGFLRVLYQIHRDMRAYRKVRKREGTLFTRSEDAPAEHIRVPAIWSSAARALREWTDLLLALLDRSTPVLGVTVKESDHVDLIVGRTSAADLHVIVADTPLASNIPYRLERGFVERATRSIDSWQKAARRSRARRRRPAGAGARKPVAAWKRRPAVISCIAAGMLAVVVLAVLVAGGMRPGPTATLPGSDIPCDAAEWRAYKSAFSSWLGLFLEDLEAEGRLERMCEMEAFRGWANELRTFRRRDAGSPDPVVVDQIVDDDERTREQCLLAGIRRKIEASLDAERWEAIQRLRLVRDRYRERGWHAPAREMEALIEDHALAPPSGIHLWEQVDRVLGALTLDEEIESALAAVSGLQARVARSELRLLAGYPARVRRWLQSDGSNVPGGRGPEDQAALLREMAAIDRLGRRLLGVGENDLAGVEVAALPEDLVSGPASDATVAEFEAWLDREWSARLPGYRRPLEEDPRNAAEIAAAVGAISTRLDQLEELEGEVGDAAPEAKSPALREAVGSLRRDEAAASLAWIERHREEILSAHERRTSRLRGLAKEIDAAITELEGDAVGWWRRIRAERAIYRSSALNSAYAEWLDVLLPESEDAVAAWEANDFRRAREAVRRVREGLRAMDREPPGDLALEGELPRALSALRRARWESVLERAVSAPRDGVDSWLEAVHGSEGLLEFDAWSEAVASLARDLVEIARRLEGFYLFDDRPLPDDRSVRELYSAWKDHALLGDDGVLEVVGPLVRRVGDLATIDELTDRDALLLWADPPAPDSDPALALAAWRALDRVADPAWPDTAEELAREARIGRDLVAAADQLGSPDRKAELVADITRVRRSRWEGCVTRAAEPERIARALEMVEAFGIEESALEGFVLFKVLLFRLRDGTAGLRDDEESTARERLAEFLVRARSRLDGTFIDGHPGVRGVLERLAALEERERIPAGEEMDTGPASHRLLPPPLRWTVESGGADPRVLVFSWAHPTLGGRTHRLEFVRLESQDDEARPCYLCRTELSLGTALAVMDAGGVWERVDDFVRERRLGPKTWSWDPSGKILVVAPAWLDASYGQLDDYPPGMHPGVPAPGHPMQRVSPELAVLICSLVGCRLPTPAEWLRALRVTKDEHGAGGWANLRDDTWRIARDHIAELTRTGRPPVLTLTQPELEFFLPRGVEDQGTFHVDLDGAPLRDGYLWFMPADEGPDETFRHLIGNVAELVREASPEGEVPQTGDPDEILRAVREDLRRGRVGVLGASALSPPALRPDEFYSVPAIPAAGYSDVGIRLAFTAPRSVFLTGLRSVLEDPSIWSP